MSVPTRDPEAAEKFNIGPFEKIVCEMVDLHKKKQADYGTDGDPFANVRASGEFGIDPWLGALLRANDKMTRLKTFSQKGTLANEGVEDSLIDLANYAVISLVLWREQNAASDSSKIE